MSLLLLLFQAAGQTPVALPPPTISTWQDPVTVATLVIAVSTVVSVLVSYLMWTATWRQAKITQEMFEAANRPYVGVLSVDGMIFSGTKGEGMVIQLVFVAKNAGSVPARAISVVWRVWTENREIEQQPHKLQPIVLLPDQTEYLRSTFNLGDEYKRIQDKTLLNVSLTIKYKGVTEQDYHYEQHAVLQHGTGYALTGAEFS
jgi:hypothetical protein